MPKTIDEINARIRSGKVVVLTAEEVIEAVKEKGPRQAAREIDVVTTGTFSPMCSSGAFLNIKQSRNKMKFGGGVVHLNHVPAYAGMAAADIYLGATALPDSDPRNQNGRPGKFRYGGAHVLEALVSGQQVTLEANAHGSDCYPKRDRKQQVSLADMNDAFLLNPRNCYQNYNVAVNLSERTIYTYMGKLKPKMGNANYCSAGQLSPLMNDPRYRTIGIGTRVFIGGSVGYVTWPGTQHNPAVQRNANGTPTGGAGTLSLVGDLKAMSPQWLRAVSFTGYGVSLSLAVGVPIPIIDEEMIRFVSVTDAELTAPIVDYSEYYPTGRGEADLGSTTYAELKSGSIEVKGKRVPTGCFSSYAKARQVAGHLKQMIADGHFYLSEQVAALPGAAGIEEGLS